MAVTYQAKTEAAVTANGQTVNYPTGTTAGDMLVMVASTVVTGPTVALIDLSKWRWAQVFYGSGTTMSTLVAWKRYFGSDTAPAITAGTQGNVAMYRYSGVGAVRALTQAVNTGALQDSPYVSASANEAIMWIGHQRRTLAPAPATALSRGSIETNQNANNVTQVIYREALGSDINMVQATMSNSGSGASYSNAVAVVLSEGDSYVYKGRDSASSDTTGAA